MSKINKLGKSTFVIAILSFLLVAVLAFGGTYAYFSDNASTTSKTITMGHLYLTNPTATFSASIDTAAVPNQPVFGAQGATATVTSNIAYFAKVSIEIGNIETKTVNGVDHTKCSCEEKSITNLLDIDESKLPDGWEKSGDAYYLTKAAAAADGTLTLPVSAKIKSTIGNGGSQHFMDATVTVVVTFEVVQADYIIGEGTATATTATPTQIDTALGLANPA